jgi:atypical dual specificity phosphatase
VEESTGLDLAFVTDDAVRDVLSDYYDQARRSYEARLYAPVVFLVGAVMEGLLTWSLHSREGGKVSDWSQRKLSELLRQAERLEIVNSKVQAGAWAVKGFRDLIHPYGVINSGSTRANEYLAASALATLAEVVRSLRGRMSAVVVDETTPPTSDEDAIRNLHFAWLLPGEIAGARGPRSILDLHQLQQLGIRAIVRLAQTTEGMVGEKQIKATTLEDLPLPVGDFCAPSLDDLDHMTRFIGEKVAAKEPVVVTCGAGIGRTSTVLAAYLVSRGATATEAIAEVRANCDRGPERPLQRDIIAAYADRVRQRQK